MNTHNLSIGIMAYNEERNIEALLESISKQNTKYFNIAEVIVVISGSTDQTQKITHSYKNKNSLNIISIIQDKREGKFSAINLFLNKASFPILVMVSADTVLDSNSIENLCTPLLHKSIGITGGRVIPQQQSKTIIENITSLQWELLHTISLQSPKFGELIAFKNMITQLPPTIVDEEEIAAQICSQGHGHSYVPSALVFNCTPKNLRELFQQRSRIHAGHLDLKKRTKRTVPTLKTHLLLRAALANITPRKAPFYLAAFGVEMTARIIGKIDYMLNLNKHIKWKISPSTKQPINQS